MLNLSHDLNNYYYQYFCNFFCFLYSFSLNLLLEIIRKKTKDSSILWYQNIPIDHLMAFLPILPMASIQPSS